MPYRIHSPPWQMFLSCVRGRFAFDTGKLEKQKKIIEENEPNKNDNYDLLEEEVIFSHAS